MHLQTAEGWPIAATPKREARDYWGAFQHRWTRVLPVTFIAVTAADQNNTYLFMHASRNDQELKKRIPGKRDRLHPVSVTLSFWVMRIHPAVTKSSSFHTIWRMVLKKKEPRKTQHWHMNITFQYYPLKHNLVLDTGYLVEELNMKINSSTFETPYKLIYMEFLGLFTVSLAD